MAGAFSGHLVNSFLANQTRQSAPFTSATPHIITSGAMSFNSQMHGTPVGNQSMANSSFFNSPHPSFFAPELSEATTLKIAALQAKLNQKLGPEYISQRPGPGGGPKLTYAEGWKIINLANEVFGFNGWSSNVVSLTIDFIDFNEESRRYTVGTTAIMRVTLRDGVFHEDIGYGMLENSKSKGAALDKCKKEAVTDGLKRALRNFGNLLGNCLYDKSYTQEIVKIKVAPPKFDKSELHRRPEFEETKPNITPMSAPTSASTSKPPTTANNTDNFVTPTRPSAQQPPKVLSSLPMHIRSEVAAHPSKNLTNQTATSSKVQQPIQVGHNQPTSRTTPSATRQNTILPQTETDRKPSIASAANLIRPAPPIIAKPPPNPPAAVAPVINMDADDADESFGFYSDDDAFLANVDLGEGDLGQPVLPETDLGRPIGGDDGDSDLGRAIDPEEGLGGQASGSHVSTAQHGVSTGMLTRLLPQNQQQSRLPDQLNNPSRPAPAQNNHGRAANPPSNRHPHQNQNHNQHHNQNQNPNQQSGSATGTKRLLTSSMGGFNFPPGVNPQQQQQQSRPPPAQGAMSGIGLKRPSDAMSSSSSTSRRPGMGLESGGTGGVKREVFGRLDVGEGGDVKRMRH